MIARPSSGISETRIAEPLSTAVILAAIFGLLGGALLSAGPQLANWALDLPWTPLAGPLRLVQEVGGFLPWWVLGLVGLVVGIGAGLFLFHAEPVICVSDRAIVIVKGDSRSRAARSQVAEVSVHDRQLVIRDRDDVELVHQKLDRAMAARVVEALLHHGWRPGAH